MTDSRKLDPYLIALAVPWLLVPATGLHVWLAWSELPERMATHWDGQWRANGWSERGDAVTLVFAMLGVTLVVLTLACALVRARKPGHAWPVLVLSYLAVGLIGWASNSIVSLNLP